MASGVADVIIYPRIINQNAAYYSAYAARDSRFDGVVFIGVTSTGYNAARFARRERQNKAIAYFLIVRKRRERTGAGPVCAGEPSPVFNLFHQFQRGKEFDTVNRWIARRLEQTSRRQNPHNARLAVRHPTRLFGIEANTGLKSSTTNLASASAWTSLGSSQITSNGFINGLISESVRPNAGATYYRLKSP